MATSKTPALDLLGIKGSGAPETPSKAPDTQSSKFPALALINGGTVDTPAPTKKPSTQKTTAPVKPKGFLDSIYNDVRTGANDVNDAASKGLQSLFGEKDAPAVPKKPKTPALDLINRTGNAPEKKEPTPALAAIQGTNPIPKGAFPVDPEASATEESTPQTNSGSDTISTIKDFLQGLPRDAVRVGISAGQAALNLESDVPFSNTKKLGEQSEQAGTIQPTGLMADLIGPEPVTGLADTAAKYEKEIQNSDFAKKYGLNAHATSLAVLGAVSPVGLDFLGVGGEESALKAIAASTDVSEIAGILRKIGVHDDLVLPLATHLSDTTDIRAVKAALDTTEALQKTTKAVEPYDNENSIHRGAGFPSVPELAQDMRSPDEAFPVEGTESHEEEPFSAPAENGSSDLPIAQAGKTVAQSATRPAAVVEKDLSSMIEYQSFLKDTLTTMPGRDLMPYRSPLTGELPYIEKGATSKFGKRGDAMLQDLIGQDASGNGDIDVANEKLSDYIKTRDEKLQVDEQVKQLRNELKASRTADKETLAQEAAARKTGTPRAASPARASVRSEKEGSQSIGDYLRRGAMRVMDRSAPVADTVVKGNASDQAQRGAILETEAGDITSGPFKGFSTQMKNWYQDWIFSRQAAGVETKLALRPFTELKEKGMDWIDSYTGHAEEGEASIANRAGIAADVRDLLDRWLGEEQQAGIKVAEKQNYFPIYLKDVAASEPVDSLGERRLGIRPGFSLQSQFKDYAEARAAGYDPRFDNAYDILNARAQAHFKAMADATMFRTGVRNGWVIPEQAISPELRNEFKILDPNTFPHMPAVYGNTVNVRNFEAPTKLADKIDTYLRKPSPLLQKVANISGTLKNTALSVGIPFTGISVHFWNVLPREAALSLAVSPLKAPLEIGKYFYYGINPGAAQKFIDANMERALPLIRAGMKFSSEDHDPSEALIATFKKVVSKEGKDMYIESTGSKLGAAGKATADFLHHVFAGNTFDKLLPARKIENGLKLLDFYTKKGLSVDEAARLAADDVNTVYGGINWEALGRDRNWQNFLRSTLMASDFAATNARIGSRIVKAFANPRSPQAQLYRRIAYATAAAYLVGNVVNHENTGHFMWQNDILHQMSLDLGKASNGKEMYFNAFGTGADFVRIPMEAATAIATQNYPDLNSIIRNRLSIPVASAFSLIENVDWKGDPILGPDKYGNPQSGETQAGNVFNNTIGNVLPGSLQTAGQLAAGKETVPQFATQAAGLPVSFKNLTPTTADVSALKARATADLKKGDYRLFNQLVKAGVISSKTKAAFVRTALKGKTVKQQKGAAKTKAKTAKEKQNLLDMGYTTAN